MAVEGVNNNNTAYYAGGAALLGGGIGATAGYMTKSILKDGNYTDEFLKSVENNLLNSEGGKFAVEMMKLDEKAPNYMTQIIDVVKKHAKMFGIDPKEVTKADCDIVEMLGGSDRAREMVADMKCQLAASTGEIIETGENTNIVDVIRRHIPSELDEVYDRNVKEFIKQNSEGNDMFQFAKKAQRNLKLKAAGIYGAIGAAVLGLGTLLVMGSKKPEAPQGIDEQA